MEIPEMFRDYIDTLEQNNIGEKEVMPLYYYFTKDEILADLEMLPLMFFQIQR